MAAFEKARPRLEEEGIVVIAASTDPLDKASETVKEHALGFPVGYALPVKETAATLGAFYEEKRGFLQATGFVVKPDRTVTVRQITVGVTEGDDTEITGGIEPGDVVVMTGVDKLQEGTQVNVQMTDQQVHGSAKSGGKRK